MQQPIPAHLSCCPACKLSKPCCAQPLPQPQQPQQAHHAHQHLLHAVENLEILPRVPANAQGGPHNRSAEWQPCGLLSLPLASQQQQQQGHCMAQSVAGWQSIRRWQEVQHLALSGMARSKHSAALRTGSVWGCSCVPCRLIDGSRIRGRTPRRPQLPAWMSHERAQAAATSRRQWRWRQQQQQRRRWEQASTAPPLSMLRASCCTPASGQERNAQQQLQPQPQPQPQPQQQPAERRTHDSMLRASCCTSASPRYMSSQLEKATSQEPAGSDSSIASPHLRTECIALHQPRQQQASRLPESWQHTHSCALPASSPGQGGSSTHDRRWSHRAGGLT